MGRYSASLSQTQGRSGFSVIFRHPMRPDPATGKPGLRVRRGLGTRDETKAGRLRDELNVLLGDTKYHDPSARREAERRFDPRVVNIFFDNVDPEATDFAKLRDDVVPLPESGPNKYRRVLLLGTTGAGKTTLVRQLIGTDPEHERFPSTSTAKTTIHDTEIVLAEGDWRAVVTFASRDEVREHLNECISAAVLAAVQRKGDAVVLDRLLDHVGQRFRFRYVLGNGPADAQDFDDEEEPADEPDLLSEEERGAIANTTTMLAEAVKKLTGLAGCLRADLSADLDDQGDDDGRVSQERYEEELDNRLRHDERFHHVADSLMEEIEKRFDLLTPGTVQKSRQGWPLTWSHQWPTAERAAFLRTISRFSSNHAPLFGRLLTPLVNGVRVAGRFKPTWNGGEIPRLVLLDGEGLGHSPGSSSAVPTGVSRRLKEVHAVLLVDSATQPMQAAPVAAMREVVASGNARKLIIAFTHFDQVQGDNLRGRSAKERHVRDSAEHVLNRLGVELGRSAELALRERLEGACFFLAGIHERPGDTAEQTVSGLRRLLDAIGGVVEPPKPDESQPVYERASIVLVVRAAAEAFHQAWRPRLGLDGPSSGKEHWTRVRALNRRLAMGWADQYDTLRPVADLRKELLQRLYVFVQNPIRWQGDEPQDDQKKQARFDAFTENLGRRLLDVCTRRIWRDCGMRWQDAYDKRGRGSTFERAEIIGDQIYRSAAPVPDVVPSPARNQFLREVMKEVAQAAKEARCKLQ